MLKRSRYVLAIAGIALGAVGCETPSYWIQSPRGGEVFRIGGTTRVVWGCDLESECSGKAIVYLEPVAHGPRELIGVDEATTSRGLDWHIGTVLRAPEGTSEGFRKAKRVQVPHDPGFYRITIEFITDYGYGTMSAQTEEFQLVHP